MKHFEHSPLLSFVNAGIVRLLGRCVTMMAVAIGLCLTACDKNSIEDLTEDPVSTLGELTFYLNGEELTDLSQTIDLVEGDLTYTVTGSGDVSVRIEGEGWSATAADGTITITSVIGEVAQLEVTLTLNDEVATYQLTVTQSGLRGTGTEDDPYLISSKNEMQYFETQSADNTFEGEYFAMTNDIDLENEAVQISDFYGTFDGKGYTISNLNIQDDGTSYYIALFKYLNGGTVCNLNVEGTVSLTTSLYSCYAGGVVAYANSGSTVKNCTFKGDVTAEITNAFSAYVGGVAGCVWNDSKIMGCAYLGGTVAAYGTMPTVAGVVGSLQSSYAIGCYNEGTVTHTGTYSGYAGGVAGYSGGSGVHMVACYNHGTVENNGSEQTYIGSLAGYSAPSSTGTVTACYDIQTNNLQFVGYTNSYVFFNTCYWLEDSNYSFGTDSNMTDCIAKSEEELKSQDTVDALNTAIESWNPEYSNLCTYRFAVDANGGYPVIEEQ